MSYTNKVVWSEGLFLRPHHLQQQDRHMTAMLNARVRAIGSHFWGFWELEINEEMRLQGRIAITRASGVFQDGTPFNIPDIDPAPDPVSIPAGTSKEEVYLVVPVSQPGACEVEESDVAGSTVRYRREPFRVRDVTEHGERAEDVDVARLRLTLVMNPDVDTHEVLGVVKVKERAADWLDLDSDFIPPCTDIRASSVLKSYVHELHTIMGTRGSDLAQSIGGEALRSLPDGDDLLLLTCISRSEPVIGHFLSTGGVDPETLYTHCLGLAGELVALTPPERRLPNLPPYQHDDLGRCFRELFHVLSDALSFRRQQRLFPLRLSRVRPGYEWRINRRDLLDDAEFWIAVSGQGQTLAEVRENVENYLLVAPADKIEELSNRQVSGIPISEAEPPNYIRKLDGYAYYRLDRGSAHWQDLQKSEALQIRIRGLKRPECQLYAVMN